MLPLISIAFCPITAHLWDESGSSSSVSSSEIAIGSDKVYCEPSFLDTEQIQFPNSHHIPCAPALSHLGDWCGLSPKHKHPSCSREPKNWMQVLHIRLCKYQIEDGSISLALLTTVLPTQPRMYLVSFAARACYQHVWLVWAARVRLGKLKPWKN